MESWGKRRRRSIANATEEKAEDMTLSQEILVLDFGDEKQSDFLKSDASIDFNEAGNCTRDDSVVSKFSSYIFHILLFHIYYKGYSYIIPIYYKGYFLKNIYFHFPDKTVTIIEPCPTKTSVLILGLTCALLVLIYISTIFCYYMKKWLSPRKMMPWKIPI